MKPFLCRMDLEEAIGKVFTGQERVQSVVDEIGGANEDSEASPDALMAQVEQAPIVRLVHGIMQAAILGGASDIHLEPRAGNIRVRFREDGAKPFIAWKWDASRRKPGMRTEITPTEWPASGLLNHAPESAARASNP